MRRSTAVVVLGACVSVALMAGCSGGSDAPRQPSQSSNSASSTPSPTATVPTASELTAALVTPEEVAAVLRSSTGPLAGAAWDASEFEPALPLGYACSKDAADAAKEVLGDRTWQVQRAAWPEGPYVARVEERLLAADPTAVETMFDAIVAQLAECYENGLADGKRTIAYKPVDLGSLGDESAAFVSSVAGEPGGFFGVIVRAGSVLVGLDAVSWSDFPDNDLPTREPVLFTQQDIATLATMAVGKLP